MRLIGVVSIAWFACSDGVPTPTGIAAPAIKTSDWTTVARGTGITVAIERALYGRQGSPHFFVRVRMTNAGQTDVGVDLRKYHEVFYPNQWGASAIDHREVIDERRIVLPAFDAPASAAVVADLHSGALTRILAGRSLDYYEEFNASSRADVDAQSNSTGWVIVTMDGQLKITDGTQAERLVPDDTTREVAIRTPIVWKTIPPGAVVIVD